VALDVVRDYQLRRVSLPEREAAKQTALRFDISISTVRRWTQVYRAVHRIFKKYHVKTRTYHPKGKSNGIRYKRYCKRYRNAKSVGKAFTFVAS